MAKKKRRTKAKIKDKLKFLGREILLTFIGAIIIGLGIMLAATRLQPLSLNWLLTSLIVWLGLLIFLYPIIKKIEDLM